MIKIFWKRSILPAIALLSVVELNAQAPAPYTSGATINYVRSFDMLAPETDPAAIINKTVRDARMTTQYVDGLGRPLQTVVRQGSMETGGTAVDMVSTVVYDPFGREVYKYLPSPANNYNGNTSITDGKFKKNPFEQQNIFMTAQYGAQGENKFYGQTNYEASPLSRPEKTMAPGSSWVGSGRGVEMKYWLNTPADKVRVWNVVDNAGSLGSYQSPGEYEAGTLVKSVTVDEHGKQVIEFKDKGGKTILKKVQLTATADNGNGAGYTDWLCTYYIYDQFGSLRCVIQPEGVKTLPGNGWNLDATLLNEQCFRYEYDGKGRMIKKKVPGAGEVWMVYDARDRLVMTQDANMRNHQKWMYTTYDDFNRPVSTGLLTDAGNYNNHNYHLAAANNAVIYPAVASYPNEELTRTFYDSYNWLPSYNNPLPAVYNNNFNTYLLPASGSWPYAQANIATNQLKGLITGSRVKVLGTNTYLYTVSFYDAKGRVIQVQSTNINSGTDITTTQYSWAGQPLIIVQKQHKGQEVPSHDLVIVTKMEYDDLSRVLVIKKAVEGTIVSATGATTVINKSEQEIVRNEYDKLGQLKKKKLAPAFNSGAGLETLNYDYNIRGWMLGMNRDYAKDASSNNYFGFDLGYDKSNNGIIGDQPYSNPQYNGNIEGMVWKSKGDGEKRKYDFSYDAANRLLKADFTQYTGGTFNQTSGVNYNVKMGDGINVNTAYDANGNIRRMQQWGLKVTGSAQIDDLHYGYEAGSNKLAVVNEYATGGTPANGANTGLGDFKDGTNATADYSYDVNGNLVLDNNKSISGIMYNHLNLPQTITVTGKGTITYTYDATGNKLRKVTTDNTVSPAKITTTDYMSGAVYENDVLQFIGHEEGRIRLGTLPSGGQDWAFDYMLKDHLGNVRMVLTEEQKQDKYPIASLEDAKIATEQQYYTINTAHIKLASSVTGLPGYINDNGIGNAPPDQNFCNANSQKVYQLNGNTNKTGLGITLKVMAGDKIDIFGKSYYFQNAPAGGCTGCDIPVLELLTGLMGTPTGAVAGGHTTAAELNTVPGVTAAAGSFINDPSRSAPVTNPNRPRAFINFVFFDEQFKVVNGNFGFSAVNTTPGLKDHFSDLQNKVAQRNGYVYIYVSNESSVNVFFDNLQVVHTRGPILEETHYYPFGLTMKGISSKAINFSTAENKMKFTSQELDDDLGISLYQMRFRNHDPQIGRFIQVDPLSEYYVYNSTYAYAENDVIRAIDIEGLEKFVMINGPGQTNHHKKEENSIVLNRATLLNGSSTTYDEKKMIAKAAEIADLFTNSETKVQSVNGTTSITETSFITSSRIEDMEGVGKVLVTTSTTKITEVKLDALSGRDGITGITETTTVGTSYSKILSEDVKNNQIKISLESKDNWTSSSITNSKDIKLENRLSETLSKLSSQLESKVVSAIADNKVKVSNAIKAIQKGIKNVSQ